MSSLPMKSGNPVLSEDVFSQWAAADRRATVMTIEGTAGKALILLAILVGTAAIAWNQAHEASPATPFLMFGGLIGGLILALVTTFKPTWSPVTAPMYAACEGLVLGSISAFFNAKYQGIVAEAVGLTFGVMFLMLAIYVTRLIRVTPKLAAAIMAATGAVCLVYLATWILGFFGVAIPYIHQGGAIGIGFSLFVVGIAAFNLLLDFDMIERGAASEAPKFMEWYGAFGLMVTLVWLYLEILRLLSKLRDR
ncbi:MAG: Bax inhibitor-1/YccA family protein [Isosphaeraceae bacterium]